MNLHKIGVVLLALLLAGIAMVPMVSAANAINYSLVSDVSTLQFPQLHFNSSQQYVNVTTELDPEPHTQASQITNLVATVPNPNISNIPYGSIIYHSKDGVTTVFDANGNQLFAAKDATSAQLPTPKGLRPATYMHGVPSGSIVTASGNIMYVSNKNVLLFEEIDGTAHSGLKTTSAIQYNGDFPYQYVEGIQGIPTSSNLGTFITFWNAPTPPQNSQTSQPTFLWNGIDSTSTGREVLIQPVLQWNVESGQWSMASWVLWGDSGSYHTTDVTGVSSGDTIEGIMTYNNNAWRVTTKDVTKIPNLATTDLGVAGMLPNYDDTLEVWLEAWRTSVTSTDSYMPGGTGFYSFLVQDTNGVNCYPSTITPWIQQSNWSSLTGLGITNTTYWPNSVSNPLFLTTYKQ